MPLPNIIFENLGFFVNLKKIVMIPNDIPKGQFNYNMI